MNHKNVASAIETMKKAENVNMDYFQFSEQKSKKPTHTIIRLTTEELHTCGNTACFAGYIALSEDFKNQGGTILESDGCPMINGLFGHKAIAYYLDISETTAFYFVHGDIADLDDGEALDLDEPGREACERGDYSRFYGKSFSDVMALDVIEKLESLGTNEYSDERRKEKMGLTIEEMGHVVHALEQELSEASTEIDGLKREIAGIKAGGYRLVSALYGYREGHDEDYRVIVCDEIEKFEASLRKFSSDD